jgi:hypothetical protein
MANNTWLAVAGLQCILSDWLSCAAMDGVPLNHKRHLIFQSARPANMVKMDPLLLAGFYSRKKVSDMQP